MTTSLVATHTCPGCGKTGISNGWFACKRCWFALPFPLRNDIDHGKRHKRKLYLRATTEAVEWYAEHRMRR